VKHPRASELTRLVRAVEAAGKSVAAVEVRWEDQDGREVPVWRIVTGAESGTKVEAEVKW
jgi:hypothetical protein